MMDEFIDNIPQPHKANANSFDVVFGIMVILASGFSGYTTYKGFSYDFPGILPIVFASIIFLGLLSINFIIRQSRREAHRLTGPIAAFAFVFVFSFISNTNAIYTYFLKDTIVGQTQEEAWRVFDSQTTRVLQAISAHPSVLAAIENEREMNNTRRNLKQQITDPNNPGLGKEARKHLQAMEQLFNQQFGASLTPLKAPTSNKPLLQHQAYAEQLDNFIASQWQQMNSTSQVTEIYAFRKKINDLRNLYKTLTQKKEYSEKTTDYMSMDLLQIGNQAKLLIAFNEQLELIDTEADRIGPFQDTWSNFLNLISPTAIFLSVLLGAMLDFLAPLLCILLYKPST